MASVLSSWKAAAHRLKVEVRALYLAGRDPRTPWCAKLLAAAVVAYALSPVDLIPDFIPVLGHLDDLVIVPLGIWIVLKMVPPEVMAECRERARAASVSRRSGLWAAAAVILLWLLAVGAAVWLAFILRRG